MAEQVVEKFPMVSRLYAITVSDKVFKYMQNDHLKANAIVNCVGHTIFKNQMWVIEHGQIGMCKTRVPFHMPNDGPRLIIDILPDEESSIAYVHYTHDVSLKSKNFKGFQITHEKFRLFIGESQSTFTEEILANEDMEALNLELGKLRLNETGCIQGSAQISCKFMPYHGNFIRILKDKKFKKPLAVILDENWQYQVFYTDELSDITDTFNYDGNYVIDLSKHDAPC